MNRPVIICGPCVIEDKSCLDEVACEIARINEKYNADIIFKSSCDKANRTSASSYRGPGLAKGLEMLADVREKWSLRICTDIHESPQAAAVAEVADIIQIPAFLCRQTDLIYAAADTGRIVNIKKGQQLSGDDMRYAVQKVKERGNDKVWLTERGNMFGYNNLVVDFRNITLMRTFSDVVIMDCTHAVQRPGAASGVSGGDRKYIRSMALAAKAFGANGFFLEVHPNPDKALSDGPNSLPLKELEEVVASILK